MLTDRTFNSDPVHAHFLAVLPDLQRHAKIQCRYGDQHRRDDDVAEALATGYVNCRSLASRGRADQVYSSGFITYSVQAVRNGRHVGSAMASKDVMSERGRYRHRRQVHSLSATAHQLASARDHISGTFEQVLADTRTPVPDQAAFRIDFANWLTGLSGRDQAMIEQLATGERPSEVAKRLRISPAAVSQRREKWRGSGSEFMGELLAA